jgi:hypothetical protein
MRKRAHSPVEPAYSVGHPGDTGQECIGDKGFVNKVRQTWAKELLGLTLHIRQRDYKGFTPAFQALLDKIRRPIEGFFSVLTNCFHLTDILVKTDISIYRRVEANITASRGGHSVCRLTKLAHPVKMLSAINASMPGFVPTRDVDGKSRRGLEICARGVGNPSHGMLRAEHPHVWT